MKWDMVIWKGILGSIKGAFGSMLATYGFGEGFSLEIMIIVASFVGAAEATNNFLKHRND